ncbi:hypothetical protein D6T64_15990 [Cryobacterium melibiosiphilum]|uniref:DUF732 domain-containing protein n=1 Tax=Cryobacterium melibiosiphilum TaxID=995039 RepID=A0A3A5MP11_9MICO|nr:hypothetical protein D6T64_15990 [Cryobacterium melibiosiphilum]
MLAAIAITLLLGGCASSMSLKAEPTDSSPIASAPRITTAAEPIKSADPTPAVIPARAEMTALERGTAESVFLSSVATEVSIPDIAEERLIAAGDAACDSMDRGDSSRAAYIVVAGLLPELSELEQPIGITVMAKTLLCSEHAEY